MTMATMTASWTDGKRYWWLLSPAMPLLVLTGLINFHINGDVFGAWGTPIIVYFIVPFLDLLVGSDRSNPPEQAIADLERDRYYRWIVYAYIPIQYAVTIYGAWLAMRPTTSWFAYVGLIFSVGMINGIGINTAHELGHKRENLRALAFSHHACAGGLWPLLCRTQSRPSPQCGDARRSRELAAWAKASGHFCRARWSVRCVRPGHWSANVCRAAVMARGIAKTRTCNLGR